MEAEVFAMETEHETATTIGQAFVELSQMSSTQTSAREST